MIQINHYIQGRRKASQPSQLHPALNPYNGETIAEFPYASAEEVNSAVESAAEAFVHWRRSESRQRGEYLTRMADEIEKRAEQIATAISQSCGKPISEARFDVQDSVDCYRYYADIANGLDDNNNLSVTVSDKAFSSRLQYQPTGVVALITPWNFP
ncbi:MAG: aldehyde dehydrogenase, partial [Oceanospirillaceae bacterium]|nr:aldehyde dehydrogenase [Oceanospirillaceae bacterium]